MAEQRRQRIDAVINAIKNGNYDDKLNDLFEACEIRKMALRAGVLARVHEVYGEDYVIVKKGENPFVKEPVEAPKLSETGSPEPFDTRTESISGTDPLPESDKEREMEIDIERRGASIGGIGPGEIA